MRMKGMRLAIQGSSVCVSSPAWHQAGLGWPLRARLSCGPHGGQRRCQQEGGATGPATGASEGTGLEGKRRPGFAAPPCAPSGDGPGRASVFYPKGTP